MAVIFLNYVLPFVYKIYLYFSRLDKKTQNRIFLFLFSCQVILIVGTRTMYTGTDTGSYLKFYNSALYYGMVEKNINYFEPLFSLIGIFCGFIGLDFTGFNIIIAFLTMLFFSLAILNSEVDAFISSVLFNSFLFSYQMMNQVRQILALMIILYAVTLLCQHKKKLFVIYIVFATLFHVSSLIAICLLFFPKINMAKKFLCFYIAITCIVLVSINFIFSIIIKFTPYGGYLTVDDRYGAFDSDAILNLIVRIALIIIIMPFFNEIVKSKKQEHYYLMCFICTILLVTAIFNNAMARTTTVFFVGYMILIPKIINETKLFNEKKGVLYPLSLFSMIIYFYVYFVAKSNGFNYESVWF